MDSSTSNISTKKSPFNLPLGSLRLYLTCLHLALGTSTWGYNIGILSSILVHPGWQRELDDPSASARGLVTSIYYAGTLISYLGVGYQLADGIGRRKACRVGTGILCFGALCMAFAVGKKALGAMVMGRLACGVGVGVVSTTVPLWQSEIAPAKERGKFVTINHLGFVFGLATGLWVGYGMTFWDNDQGIYWGWRVSILLQLIPATMFGVGLSYILESPRWLMEKGEEESARKVLVYFREGMTDPEEITHELHAINIDIESHRPHIPRDAPHHSHRHLLHDHGNRSSSTTISSPSFNSAGIISDPTLFARLWRAFLLQFMAQMCGATAMKYYLPSLLKALGLGTRLALMAGAMEMTVKIAVTVVEMWLIDRVGRRWCLIGGCLVMGVAMMVNGALPLAYPGNINKTADVMCIAFIFIYAMGYSLGLGPAAWVYSSEIFPTTHRARGLNLAASGGSIGSLLVSQIWPVGIATWGSGIYFFFMVVNFICAPIIWLLYPETKGRPLEEMDQIFK